MAKRRELFYRRIFLNKPRYQTGAHFLGYVKTEGGMAISASMTITDCHRQVTLEFWTGDPKEAANNLHKARLLAKATADFADAYEKAIEGVWVLPELSKKRAS